MNIKEVYVAHNYGEAKFVGTKDDCIAFSKEMQEQIKGFVLEICDIEVFGEYHRESGYSDGYDNGYDEAYYAYSNDC